MCLLGRVILLKRARTKREPRNGKEDVLTWLSKRETQKVGVETFCAPYK